jgi:hypothetical protein
MNEIDNRIIQPTNWNLNLDFLDTWKFSKISTFINISMMDSFEWMNVDYRSDFEIY